MGRASDIAETCLGKTRNNGSAGRVGWPALRGEGIGVRDMTGQDEHNRTWHRAMPADGEFGKKGSAGRKDEGTTRSLRKLGRRVPQISGAKTKVD